MDMNDVVDWLQRFTRCTYEAQVAAYSPELDDDTHARRFAALDQFYALEENVHVGISRGREMSDDGKARSASMRARLVPRVLFMVKKYQAPGAEELYRAYVGGSFKHDVGSYAQALTLAQTPRGLRIVAVDGNCMNCRGRGKVDGEPCGDCGGTGWEHESGRKLGDLGAPVEVRKLQAPTDSVSRADYESA